jgi:transcriptional regulator with XRE-family HTH domain
VISLAQRVRDFRYAKGWGPDELASRAEISRTALYQIESGKTGLPRAGTLRRIAVALDVSMDDLLGNTEPSIPPSHRSGADHGTSPARGRELADWLPAEGGPLSLPANSQPHVSAYGHFAHHDEAKAEGQRIANDPQARRGTAAGFDSLLMREGELMSKLHDLLHSSLGVGIARIVDELHQMIPGGRGLS